jgi:ferredoxin-NADP reductase
MAIPKTARVVDARSLGPDTRLLELRMQEPLAFVGGQYVIVDSGLTLPSGKAAKRAYSLVTADDEQGRFELVVKHIPGGIVSGYLHSIEVGAELRFSGPWGKLFPAPEAVGRTFVLATDTGITAALGLLRGARFAPLLSQTTLLWLRSAPEYFVSEAFVRECVPSACAELGVEPFLAIGHPERVDAARARLRAYVERSGPPARAFITGDGSVNYALYDDLLAASVPVTKDDLESFFNMPKKSA